MNYVRIAGGGVAVLAMLAVVGALTRTPTNDGANNRGAYFTVCVQYMRQGFRDRGIPLNDHASQTIIEKCYEQAKNR